MIELTNVSKVYKTGTNALKDVNLKVEKGEFVFVVGSSGAGKSTLIKLLLREETATSGIVQVNGINLNKITSKQIPYFRRSLGVVFQDFRLIPNMTVYENVAFALRVTNVPTRIIRKRVPYILSLVGLTSKAKSLPEHISGGEQQRVALARALVNNPTLLIADEPTGNIDPELSFEIMQLLSEINRCGTTVVMVTHDHELVRQFPNRIITIEGGRITFDGRNDARNRRTVAHERK
ncbi:MAG: cell division ATP-binding protein FtsE [Oscillospiraceae bacterium]